MSTDDLNPAGYLCPTCGGGFDDPETIVGEMYHVAAGRIQYLVDGCPWCGEELDTTRRKPMQVRGGLR